MAVIDLKQFYATFFAESLSGLDAMEADLLRLEANTGDSEITNAIFRVVHSIKGASSTFGFNDVAAFSHTLESFLDKLRNGHVGADAAIVNTLLQSVDALRAMLGAARSGTPLTEDSVRLRASIEAQLAQVDSVVAPAAASAGARMSADAAAPARYRIAFRPHAHLLKSGNDPLRLLQMLERMGELSVRADIAQLPALEAMEPEQAYLAWELELVTRAPRREIDEIFEWVADDCTLAIELLSEPQAPVVAAPLSAAALLPTAELERPTQHEKADAKADIKAEAKGGASLHVSTEKVDDLINLVGELVITQTMLKQVGENFSADKLEKLQTALAQLERNTRELQHRVMSIRMLPASFAFNRFARMVRDTGQALGKKVELKISGEQSELDKTVIEKLIDPLMHLIRNSLDHGIETPAARLAAGKPETASLHLHAEHKGGNVVIQIKDDGQGLNRPKIRAKALERGLIEANAELSDADIDRLIFLPGFSTADVVSDVSGRGVGMDVVRRNILSLGGNIDIQSEPGKGVTFTIRLPLTLAIVDGMSVALAGQSYILPLTFIVESIQPQTSAIRAVAGAGRVIEVRGEYVPVVLLHELLGVALPANVCDGILVLLEAEGKKIALLVDALLGQDQVVIKSLEANYRKVRYVSGATILGDGRVALILDANALVRAA